MTLTEISLLRLINQKIEASPFSSVNEVVRWMGAMQAQDYAMAKWAIGKRMTEATDDKVEKAVNDGEIIRTHVLRPTWHFVSAADIYWMLELTATRIKASMKSRNKDLELSREVFSKCFTILIKQLSICKNMNREQIAVVLNAANIKTDENRLSHILMEAELEGLLCSGCKTGNKLTYGFLPERVPHRIILTKDESLAVLAKRYFTSHGPATIRDFAWWSGLSAADVRDAMGLVKPDLLSEIVGDEQYWFSMESPVIPKSVNSVHFLPAFDEFLISYKDRTSSLSLTHHNKAVSDNGIFRPVIVINGMVAGIWKRTIKNEKVIVELYLFQAVNKAAIGRIEFESVLFGQFLNKNTELIQI